MTGSGQLPEVSDLTTAEKASLTSGADFWTTKSVERAGVPALMLTDGPHGLRKQNTGGDHLGLGDSVPATCFPPAVGLGSSWDPDLAERVGVALGVESAIEDVAVILGPGVNIKRSPLCGRNFEYFSEDPLIGGVMGAALVRGIQSQGVGSSLKHFAANNQETDRMRASSDVDARPLREIYLRGFQRVVAEAQPWTVMCSYNRINGVYASEDPWLLTSVLRDEWGYTGLVVSDWGAVNDRVAALVAGLDLEMPASGGRTDAQIVDAIESGRIDESVLDLAAERMLELIRRTSVVVKPAGALDVEAHHDLAREAAARSIVLLRNEGDILPLNPQQRIAVVGAFADQPRYQGAGSSLINPTRLDRALEEIRAIAPDATYAAGFSLDGSGDAAALRAEAVAVAAEADVVVAFLGLPAAAESEGYDRTDIDLPADQLALVAELRAANPNIVVVLSNGGVVALPFRDEVPAIVEAWLGGQGGGHAAAQVLFGAVNPSGRLTETIPLKLEDNPSFGNFPGEFGHVRYGEGILVGYRWYDARELEVAYPFGHGLSYTSFAYGDVSAAAGDDGITVRVDVTNTGERDGRTVVQAYASIGASVVQRAPRELKAFQSVAIAAGATTTVELRIPRADLAYWDVRVDRWVVEGGEYTVSVGESSRDLRGSATVSVTADEVNIPITPDSSLGEVLAHPVVGPMVQQAISGFLGAGSDAPTELDEGMLAMLQSLPLARMVAFPGSPMTPDAMHQLIAAANA